MAPQRVHIRRSERGRHHDVVGLLQRREAAEGRREPSRPARGGARWSRQSCALHQLHPAVPARGREGRGPLDHRRRRQRVPRLHRGHRGHLDRPLAPQGRRRDRGAGAPIPPHVRDGFLLRAGDPPRGAPRRARAGQADRARVLRELRRRDHRGGAQARALGDAAPALPRVYRRVPWTDHGRAFAYRQQGRAARRVRAARPGRVPRALSVGQRRRAHERRGLRAHRSAVPHAREAR